MEWAVRAKYVKHAAMAADITTMENVIFKAVKTASKNILTKEVD
jgi:hypothetical protein